MQGYYIKTHGLLRVFNAYYLHWTEPFQARAPLDSHRPHPATQGGLGYTATNAASVAVWA